MTGKNSAKNRHPQRPQPCNAADQSRRRPGKVHAGRQNSTLERYLKEVRRYPVLSREEEIELVREVQKGGADPFNRLIECNLRFVIQVAGKYRHLGVPLEDLVNEGNLGLIEAARRFDPDRGIRFISWAVWWIRRSIFVALSEQSHAVRLPISQINRMRVVKATERALLEDLGREPTLNELSAKLPEKLANVDPIHLHGLRLSSLDEPAGDDNQETGAAILRDTDRATIEEQMLAEETAETVSKLCEQLNDQQRNVIHYRFGLNGESPLTLRETGERMGRSREGVRLIERQALNNLRKRLSARPAAHRPVA